MLRRFDAVVPPASTSADSCVPFSSLFATAGNEPLDTLTGYRADPRVDGGIAFGMNAVIVEGVERALRVGQAGRASIRF